MGLDRIDGGFDENRLIVHQLHVDVLGERLLQLLQPVLDQLRRSHGVGSGLLRNDQGHRRLPVQPRGGRGLFLAVFGVTDVAQLHRVRSARGDGDFVELRRIRQAAQGPHRQLAGALGDAAGRQFEVLLAQRVGHVGDRKPVGPHPLRIHPHPDLALQAAHQADLADSLDVLQPLLDLLVGQLGDLAQRPRPGNHQLHDGRRVGIELLDHRGLGRLRQIGQSGGDFIANFLGSHVAVLLQRKADDHGRKPLDRGGANVVNIADGIDRILDALGDVGFDFLRRGARIDHGNRHRRHVHLGRQIHAQRKVGEASHHHQG